MIFEERKRNEKFKCKVCFAVYLFFLSLFSFVLYFFLIALSTFCFLLKKNDKSNKEKKQQQLEHEANLFILLVSYGYGDMAIFQKKSFSFLKFHFFLPIVVVHQWIFDTFCFGDLFISSITLFFTSFFSFFCLYFK